MRLIELQRRMAADVMRPQSARAAGASGYLTPNSLLTAAERLDIYHRQYWFRLLDALADDFPAMRALLGERAFSNLSKAYLAACPSKSFTLRDLGSHLPSWLKADPGRAGKYGAGKYGTWALDLARLEWAHVEAFDASSIPPLDSAALAAGPELRPKLQPYLRLLEVSHPADEIRLAVNRGTFQRARLHFGNAMPGKYFIAVHRMDGNVFYRRLESGEFQLLRRMERGLSLGDVLAVRIRGLNDPETAQSKLRTWFEAWTAMGWLAE